MPDQRPVYLNLVKIHLPVTGVVSLAHRVSGVLLFLFIPFAVYLLDSSIESAQSFERVQQLLQQPLMLLLQIVLFWSLAHHFFAGIRFILIDAEIGIEKHQARIGSWLVLLAEALTVLLIIFMVMS
ncbi:MAG: succinate dehydrogenase, cytochrome b556 subunit [Proteobacteria bacterium]|nr:succinate dehydrogenase, cytochrome b556 subunit [Pseudomonadota bacterium]